MTTETVLTDEQREDLYLAYLEPDMPGDEGDAIIKTIEQAALQSPEVQRLREDARRYRWLRNESLARAFGDGVLAPVVFKCDDEFQHSDVDHLQLSELDIEIDAAMERQP